MYSYNDKIYLEDDDICNSCKNYVKNFECPLLAALTEGDVFLEGSLIVTRCGFYKEFRRTLHLVREDEHENDYSD